MAGGKVGFQIDSGVLGRKQDADRKSVESRLRQPPKQPKLKCPECTSERLYKDGFRYPEERISIQRWLCRDCGFRFSDPQDQTKYHDALQHIETIQSKTLKSRSTKVNTRQICALEAKNLDPTSEIKTVAGMEKTTEADLKGKLLQFEFYCKKEGLEEITAKTFVTAIRSISKYTQLISDPESVKEALSKMTVSENTKFLYTCAYTRFLNFLGKTWKPPKYGLVEKLPEFLPTEIELDQLIAGCGRRTSALLQLIKETGMRLGECLRLTWICINVDMRIITLTHAEKRSSPRVFNVSTTLIGMLNSLSKESEKVFGKMNKCSATTCLINQRKRIANRLNNPRIAKIHYHLIRHWYATLLYHKTHDIHHVAQMLGHKHTMTTEIYINMEKMAFNTIYNEYNVKIASTIEEACKLLEVGFEYVTEIDGKKLFRQRK